jgi:hypothetical protein
VTILYLSIKRRRERRGGRGRRERRGRRGRRERRGRRRRRRRAAIFTCQYASPYRGHYSSTHWFCMSAASGSLIPLLIGGTHDSIISFLAPCAQVAFGIMRVGHCMVYSVW